MKPEIYKDEGYKLMGAAFEGYNERGYGLGEETSSASTTTVPFSGNAFPRISRIHTDSRNGTENIRNSSPLTPSGVGKILTVFDSRLFALSAGNQMAASHHLRVHPAISED